MEWKQPTVETTRENLILAIIKFYDEDHDEYVRKIKILHFHGLSNRWIAENGSSYMQKEIEKYIAIPPY